MDAHLLLSVRPFSQPLLALPSGLMNEVAAAGVKEIMHGLSKTDLLSSRPIWLKSLLSA